MAQAIKGLYYKKDKKAQIYKKVTGSTDAEGFALPSGYFPIAPSEIWCYSSQLSQTDIFVASAYGQSETRFFVFNHYKGIEVYDMVRYRGKWYRVTRVDTKDDYNGEVFVYVEIANGGWIPKNTEIMPYTPGKWKE